MMLLWRRFPGVQHRKEIPCFWGHIDPAGCWTKNHLDSLYIRLNLTNNQKSFILFVRAFSRSCTANKYIHCKQTCPVAYFSIWTGDAVKAADRFTFLYGHASAWGTALTTHWPGRLMGNNLIKLKPNSSYKTYHWQLIVWKQTFFDSKFQKILSSSRLRSMSFEAISLTSPTFVTSVIPSGSHLQFITS